MKSRLRAVGALLLVLLAGIGISLIAGDDDRIPAPPPSPTAVTVDGPDADTIRNDTLPVTPAGQDLLDQVQDDSTRTGEELEDPLREPDDPSRTPPGQLEGPLAAQEFPGCRTAFVRNYSSRNGQKPRVIVWHQTVSRENGSASQNALTAMANRPSSGVSWHFLIGRTNGLCTFSVPLNMKAWTQGNANPFSIGIEVEAYGDEPAYVTGDGERKLLAVTRELGRRFDIPMRRGEVTNCRVVRSGIVEHADLGACGGGHADVTPWATGKLLEQLRNGGVTNTDRVTCRKLNWWRRAGRPHGKPERNAVRRRKALEARGVTCTARGPVKR